MGGKDGTNTIEVGDKAKLTQLEIEQVKSLLMKVDTNITLESVVLSEANKFSIDEFVREVQGADLLLKAGLTPMNRLLFYGDSGCGKTYLGKALSNHLGYTLLYIDIAKAIANHEVADNMSLLFKVGNSGHFILFLDECDSIAWNRNAENADTSEYRRAVTSLFQQMDQMSPKTIIICATNLLAKLDQAFENRFDMKLEFRRPKEEIIKTIRKFLKEEYVVKDDLNREVKSIVDKRVSNSLSYRDLTRIANRAMKRAVLQGTRCIMLSDIYKDVARTAEIIVPLNKFSKTEDMTDKVVSNNELYIQNL